jgi:hypothetical protein
MCYRGLGQSEAASGLALLHHSFMPKHGYGEVTPVQQKSRNFDPASLPHATLRTTSNRIDALKIPEALFSACHQLWGHMPDDWPSG